jgi:hypothetical protein
MLAIEFALDVWAILHFAITLFWLTYIKDTHTLVQHSAGKLNVVQRDMQVCSLQHSSLTAS